MDLAQKLADWVDELTELTGVKHVPDPLTPPRAGAVGVAMPGYRQTDSFSCGYVAGLMALHALYPRRSAARFHSAVAPHPVTGTSTSRLVLALRGAGVAVAWRNDLDFNRLEAAFGAGQPVVTTIATAAPDTWHWVTLYGAGRDPRRVFVAGCGWPGLARATGGHETNWSDFARVWRPRGFGLVCRRR